VLHEVVSQYILSSFEETTVSGVRLLPAKFSPSSVTVAPAVCGALAAFKYETTGESKVSVLLLVPTTAPTVTTGVLWPPAVFIGALQRTDESDDHELVAHMKSAPEPPGNRLDSIAAVGVLPMYPKFIPSIVRV
jgi:hypothetical protein